MPEAEPEEEEGRHAAAVLIQDGAADHDGGNHATGTGEQNGIAHHHEGNGIAGAKGDKPATHFEDFQVRSCTLAALFIAWHRSSHLVLATGGLGLALHVPSMLSPG